MKQFGFIGMGNMGYAILKGLLKSKVPDQIIFSARNKEHMEQVAAETGVSYAADNRTCAKESACLVLAVKPQQFDTVIGEIRDAVTEEQIIISIAPGITIADLQKRFGKKCRIVRAMPNTPALVGEGMTGVCYDKALFSDKADDRNAFYFLWTNDCSRRKADGCGGMCQRKFSGLCVYVH